MQFHLGEDKSKTEFMQLKEPLLKRDNSVSFEKTFSDKSSFTKYFDADKNTGYEIMRFPNGKTKKSVRFQGTDGEVIEYYDNDQNNVKSVYKYKNLIPQSENQFYPDNKIKSEIVYNEKGNKISVNKYYPNGNPKLKWGYDNTDPTLLTSISYYENGVLHSKSTRKNGLIIGKYETYFDNSSPSHITEFDANGNRLSEVVYHESGAIKNKNTYFDGSVISIENNDEYGRPIKLSCAEKEEVFKVCILPDNVTYVIMEVTIMDKVPRTEAVANAVKLRAKEVFVKSITDLTGKSHDSCVSMYSASPITYKVGTIAGSDNYDGNPLYECSSGITVFKYRENCIDFLHNDAKNKIPFEDDFDDEDF